jgi:hypothetical protein
VFHVTFYAIWFFHFSSEMDGFEAALNHRALE